MAVQPAKQILRERYITLPDAARRIDVLPGHLRGVLNGHVSPSPSVRERLPELLGLALDELFDADLLAREWTGPRRSAS